MYSPAQASTRPLRASRGRRLRTLPIPLLLAVLVLGLLVPTAPQAVAASSGKTIVGVSSKRCLDVRGGVRDAGTAVVIYTCRKGQANQAWTLSASGELRVYDGTMCLDAKGQDTTSPAALQIYGCNGGANQQFRIAKDGTIVGAQSGLCLDAQGGRTANSTKVELYTCNGRKNQQWKTALTSDSTPPTVPGTPQVADLTCTSVTFRWTASTDKVGVAFYDVYHDGQLITSVPGTQLSTSLTVVPGSTWGLYVNARDASGNVSQASRTVTIQPPPCSTDDQPPTPPTDLTASASGTTVTLSWTASTDNVGVRAYDVLRAGVKVGTVSGTATVPPATSFIDSGLAPRTTYAYTVVARDAQSNLSDPSNVASATTGASCASAICGVTQVATETDIPWGLVTLADGTILYSRRDAHDIIHLNPATGAKTTLGTVPNVEGTDGEGGLLGLALSPTYATDHWLYVMHTSPSDNRIVRIQVVGDKLDLGTEQILLTGILRNKYHNGGRLRFGPDGKLYASTGDAQNGANAQNKSSLNGKILRLNPDGSVPADNPFGSYVWSYGHRNPQGLAFDSQGRLWEQEFGNTVMDESNLITKGGNYGWPSCEGTHESTTGACSTPGFIPPKHTYPTSDGSCSGITIVRDVLYVACERGTRLYREVISGSSLTDVQTYYNGTYGRLRTVEPAPDGGLWLTTSNDGDKDSTPNNSNEKILHVDLGQ